MSNTEEDRIENFIKAYEETKAHSFIIESINKDFFFEFVDCLMERIQELKKENTTLRKANNITKNLTREEKMEDITQVMNKSYKEFMKNFIPVQKVKDVLQNNRNELFGTTYIDDKQYKPYTMQIDRINKIEREILEDK